MGYYRKKPVVIKALQFWPQEREKVPQADGSVFLRPEVVMSGVIKLPAMTVDARERRGITYDTPARYVVNTLEGQMEIKPGDWLVTGVTGELYPVKDHIFRMTYSPYFGWKESERIAAAVIVASLLAIGVIALWRLVW